MIEYNHNYSLASLKRELRAWKAHTGRLGLSDRLRFVEWISESFDPKEMALTIDAEIDRSSLWKTYLWERYGPEKERS